MTNWYMLTLVGEDQAAIVANVTQALFEADCHLGEASMIRLGGNFTVMLMVQSEGDSEQVRSIVQPVADKMQLRIHVDPIQGHLHEHHQSDVQISVFGADRAGIVAQVTNALTTAGLEILDLNTDVAGTESKPLYIMQIEGLAKQGIDALQSALDAIDHDDMDVRINEIDTLVG
jgi:glycine cleavage system transcriptional repressor